MVIKKLLTTVVVLIMIFLSCQKFQIKNSLDDIKNLKYITYSQMSKPANYYNKSNFWVDPKNLAQIFVVLYLISWANPRPSMDGEGCYMSSNGEKLFWMYIKPIQLARMGSYLYVGG